MVCPAASNSGSKPRSNAAGHMENDRAGALDAIRKSLEFLDTSGALHTQDEEDSLFPRLRPKLSSPGDRVCGLARSPASAEAGSRLLGSQTDWQPR